MSLFTNTVSQATESTYQTSKSQSTERTKTKSNYGKTIGSPQLSEEGQKYYEELKKKYSNMDFILVSEDMKDQAQAQAGNYANANRMVVLIDEDKIEQMASDEDYREKYEAIISNAATKLPELQSSLGSTSNVKTYGMQVNSDGTASYFAVLEKSSQAQRERIAKSAEKKAAQKKAAKKAEEKQQTEERLEKAAEKRKSEREELSDSKEETTVTITASSIEELLQKISDQNMADLSDQSQTDEEKMIGQHIDFRG